MLKLLRNIQHAPPDSLKFARHKHLKLIHPALGSRQSSVPIHIPPIGIPRSGNIRKLFVYYNAFFYGDAKNVLL